MSTIGTKPIRLVCNRIYRAYPGGREMEYFRGAKVGEDDLRPEAWVGSDTRTVDADTCGDPRRGLAEYYTESGGKAYLKDLLEQYPTQLMGERHVREFGSQLGILVKLLDAQKQLGLQCHPDRGDAMKYFNSKYGKLECWYVISTRTDGEDPYMLLGFKENITREAFEEYFLRGDVPAMERFCHKITPTPGDMYFVDAGLPHAIGPGCFVVEVQEPSDITLGARYQEFDDPEQTRHFVESTMGCYHYEGNSFEDNLKKYRVESKVLSDGPGGREELLIGKPHTDYFSVTKAVVDGEMPAGRPEEYSIVIITGGNGKLFFDGGEMDVKQGDELFLPAGLGNARWSGKLEAIHSYPPNAVR